jgi:hypothetical protein
VEGAHSAIQRPLAFVSHIVGKALHALREHTLTADNDGEKVHEEVKNEIYKEKDYGRRNKKTVVFRSVLYGFSQI